MEEPEPPLILSPSSSVRRRSNVSNSPEFEFSNPSFPNFNILSADELFSGGVLLPLQHLHLSNTPPESEPSTAELANLSATKSTQPSSNKQDPPEESGSDRAPVTELESTAELSASNSTFTSSKRWVRDIFKKIGDDLQTNSKEKGNNNNNSVKEKKREKKNGTGVGATNTAELNINIWPFSRSRSAGNGGTRPRSTAASTTTRKVSSAPCSRSNSRGESKSRKWPNSPNRAGFHLGKSSPVLQARRSVSRNLETAVKKDGNEDRQRISGGGSRGRVLSLNVPTCIGYRQHLSCGSDENVATSATTEGAPGGGRNVGEGKIKQQGSREIMSARDKKPSKPSSSRTGGIRTLSDLNRPSADSDSDSDAPQEYYTGGEKSGMIVQDPTKGNNVDAIFDQARQQGAVQGPLENLQPSSSSRSFTGTGRLLSGETAPAPAAPQQPESLVHNIVFWRNGFTVNDGL
ncbi:hypothetical protein RD792_017865 [Penstemon davidsonii]|uniref:SEP domain-containing protein n=1 Tax=Penstemon davidsonii TaxID=160366 RepID=A0ABR0DW14_9LAMI|nr:hypothetical protein RD792_017865 [Penstemon davidsonii]